MPNNHVADGIKVLRLDTKIHTKTKLHENNQKTKTLSIFVQEKDTQKLFGYIIIIEQ